MSDTPNLKLPYLLAAQAQKHVIHNEALRMLDAVVQLSVIDRDLATPPGSPANGDRYIVAAAPTGAWSGHAAHIAAFQDGAWMFYAALEGWLAWIADENVLTVFDGASWTLVSSGGGGGASDHGLLTGLGDDDHPQYHNNARGDARYAPIAPALFGINATADATNRFALSSAASLFNHAGNGHQVKVNKNAAGDTASFLFQTGFSGRAEIGTTGDDNFHFKVSSNGSTWIDALFLNATSGNVNIRGTGAVFPFTVNTPSAALAAISGSTAAIGLSSPVAALFTGESTANSGPSSGGLLQLYCNDGAALASGDRIGGFLFGGSSSATTLRVAGSVEGFATENWVDGSAYGSKVSIRATPNGATGRSEKLIVEGSGPVTPGADNTQTLGSASLRWSVVYAGTGTINTSDGDQKTVRGGFSSKELKAWGRVNWKIYQWKSSVEEKGLDGARLHAGLVAQDILESFKAEGLDAHRYGLFCEDVEYETVETGLTDDGAVITEQRPTAKKRLGLRYDQCQAFESAWVRSKIKALEEMLQGGLRP